MVNRSERSICWSSGLRVMRRKMTLNVFFPLCFGSLFWHISPIFSLARMWLCCAPEGCFTTAEPNQRTPKKPNHDIKLVNGPGSSHPRKSIKVFSSHFALAVSHQTLSPKKELCFSASSFLCACQDSVFGMAPTLEPTFLSSTAVNKTPE